MRRPVLSALLALAGMGAPAAWAAVVEVAVGGAEFRFSPQTVTIEAGDTVRWTNAGGIHNVTADGGSFRSGAASGAAWVFEHTFASPGTFGYHCEPHRFLGMVGTVVVQPGGGGGEQRGALRFSSGTFTVAEGAGSAAITVRRVNGDDGAVSVQYATANGTAAAGSDYTARSGTLSWADGDDGARTFTVPVLQDTAAEGNQTVRLSLASPGGGATLGNPSTAVLTIADDDAAPGGPPAAPADLAAHPHSTTEVLLTWSDAATDETGFRIERRTIGESFAQVATVPADATSFTASGLEPGTFYLFRVRAANAQGASAFSNEAGAGTLEEPGSCVEGEHALCVNGGRFGVEVDWATRTLTERGFGVPVPSAPDSGLFYFFSPSNLEMLVKVLNACALNDRFWVFFAATTNVEFALKVTDTRNGRTKFYFNPLDRAAPPVQDTDAFATCP